MRTKGIGRLYAKEISIFSKRLKQFRRLKGWTQEKLGLETHLGSKHISDLENATVDPSLSTIVRLSESLGISPAVFFFNSREAERAAKLFNLSSFYEPEEEHADTEEHL